MKMKKITITLIFLSVFACLKAQDKGNKAPQIAFTETAFAFDTLTQNAPCEHLFSFTNTGNAPLVVSSAFSSCGCVVPEWPKEPVMPGKKGTIKVVYNTSKAGNFNKAIVVKSNATASPKTVLRITGVVKEGKAGKTKL